jgi:hypothetical protein
VAAAQPIAPSKAGPPAAGSLLDDKSAPLSPQEASKMVENAAANRRFVEIGNEPSISFLQDFPAAKGFLSPVGRSFV